jgi:drug/metabolite transporter (DMT)-like permease
MVNIALVLYMGMQGLGKAIMNKPEGPISYMEFSFFRSLFLTITSYALLQRYEVKVKDVPQDCKVPLIARCLIGTFTFVLTTVSLKILPLSIYTIVLSTSPFMTALLQFFWIKERIAWYEVLAICGAYSGIVVMSSSN